VIRSWGSRLPTRMPRSKSIHSGRKLRRWAAPPRPCPGQGQDVPALDTSSSAHSVPLQRRLPGGLHQAGGDFPGPAPQLFQVHLQEAPIRTRTRRPRSRCARCAPPESTGCWRTRRAPAAWPVARVQQDQVGRGALSRRPYPANPAAAPAVAEGQHLADAGCVRVPARRLGQQGRVPGSSKMPRLFPEAGPSVPRPTATPAPGPGKEVGKCSELQVRLGAVAMPRRARGSGSGRLRWPRRRGPAPFPAGGPGPLEDLHGRAAFLARLRSSWRGSSATWMCSLRPAPRPPRRQRAGSSPDRRTESGGPREIVSRGSGRVSLAEPQSLRPLLLHPSPVPKAVQARSARRPLSR